MALLVLCGAWRTAADSLTSLIGVTKQAHGVLLVHTHPFQLHVAATQPSFSTTHFPPQPFPSQPCPLPATVPPSPTTSALRRAGGLAPPPLRQPEAVPGSTSGGGGRPLRARCGLASPPLPAWAPAPLPAPPCGALPALPAACPQPRRLLTLPRLRCDRRRPVSTGLAPVGPGGGIPGAAVGAPPLPSALPGAWRGAAGRGEAALDGHRCLQGFLRRCSPSVRSQRGVKVTLKWVFSSQNK